MTWLPLIMGRQVRAGDDDTVFFPEGIARAVLGMDQAMPYLVSGIRDSTAGIPRSPLTPCLTFQTCRSDSYYCTCK